MTIEQTIGKKIAYYDSFSGGGYSLTIESTEYDAVERELVFTGKNWWGYPSAVYVPNEFIEPLLSTGLAELHETVEGIECVTSWTIR